LARAVKAPGLGDLSLAQGAMFQKSKRDETGNHYEQSIRVKEEFAGFCDAFTDRGESQQGSIPTVTGKHTHHEDQG
jgi:hypothetical protein